ncbi:glycosyltransferase [Pseudoalteromonas sp. Angola-30]|uniref:glycosyltransferase n=1 Tax=Pseudoalteromonas sp. Angola-30 TaxID=3025341 RepID=UPI002359F033|nr:glycosyltransferase [Pseudoalteromonas sp. Angola-30]MDC9525394.1 glycosyltransferase [Pseudoalteromonas sp. Angola-30]
MKILHVHQDYPDGRNYPSTLAVSNLLDGVKKFEPSLEHYVLSINRTSNPFKVSIKKFDQGLSVIYWALPVPFVYRPIIYIWSLILFYFIKKNKFSLVHGHKLTTEGMFTYYLANKLKVPYVLSVRGGSDTHNIKRLPDCKSIFSKIYRNSKVIFYVSPWCKGFVESELRYKHPTTLDLPNICQFSLHTSNSIDVCSRQGYVTILSFHQYKRKGLEQLLTAIKKLKDGGVALNLTVIGSGDNEYVEKVKKLINGLSLANEVSLTGSISQKDVLKILKQSRAFLLPSKNETFGMTYVESLASGCPILYLENTGIDGHLECVNAGVKIPDNDVDNIEKSLFKFENEYSSIKKGVELILDSHYLKKFTEEKISENYTHVLRSITELEKEFL